MRLWIVALIVSCLASGARAQNATVSLKKIVEKRQSSVEKNPFASFETGIDLTVSIDGPTVNGARKFGKRTITKAVDDVGTDLTKRSEDTMDMADQFQDIRGPMQWGADEGAPKAAAFEVELKLPTPSARGAKMIKEVRGSVAVLVGGERKVVEVKKLKSNRGRAIDDPVLKQAGVTIMLIDPSKKPVAVMMGMKDKSVMTEVSGNIDALAEVKIIDGAGESVSQGSLWNDDGDKRSVSYLLEKELTDDMTLQLEVWPGQQSVTVPIELKDIKLP